jgi:hypothetical protein
LSRIEEDGRNWLRRPKLCTKSCRAIRRRRWVNISQLKLRSEKFDDDDDDDDNNNKWRCEEKQEMHLGLYLCV